MACCFVDLCIPSARLGAQRDKVAGRDVLGLGAARPLAVHYEGSLAGGAYLFNSSLHISLLHSAPYIS